MHEVPVCIYICMYDIYMYMYDYMIYLYYIYICMYIHICVYTYIPFASNCSPPQFASNCSPFCVNQLRKGLWGTRPEEQTHSSPPQHSSQLPSPLPPQPLSHLSPQALLQNCQLPAANDTVIKA